MVVLLMIVMIAAFITSDALVRYAAKRYQESRAIKRRMEALDIGLRLEFTEEAPSLKRVTVERPKARILAVDDEGVVLDSFRKILVLAGYSVDTVETGPEAVGLVRKNEYDFVFTDLKMPGMDGVEVTKAVKHLRPDIDVIMITGYATIESAVDVMKYGALDYVQKPFTEDELVTFVDKSFIRRQAKIEREMRPSISLVESSSEVSPSERVVTVPAGFFVAPGHTWLTIETNGAVRVGLDDFAYKAVGEIDEVLFPESGVKVRRGQPLFRLRIGKREISVPSPVNGQISLVNTDMRGHVGLMKMKPYELGWVCSIAPANLPEDLKTLRIGKDAESWYQHEIDKHAEIVKKRRGEKGEGEMTDELWRDVGKLFLHL